VHLHFYPSTLERADGTEKSALVGLGDAKGDTPNRWSLRAVPAGLPPAPSHIDISLTFFLAVGFSRALDLLAAFQPMSPKAATCVEALEDGGRGYPALPLLDREILIYPAVHF